MRSVTSCTTNGTCPGVATIVGKILYFLAAWKAFPWTSSSSETSTRGERARHRFGTLRLPFIPTSRPARERGDGPGTAAAGGHFSVAGWRKGASYHLFHFTTRAKDHAKEH